MTMTPDNDKPSSPVPTAKLPGKAANTPKPGTPAYNRMARRKAVRMGLNPSSGEDAVRMLKERGFDVTGDKVTIMDTADATRAGAAGGNLPARVGQTGLANTEEMTMPGKKSNVISEEERQQEIARIQRDIARRRRGKFLLIFLRLAFFVIAPTALTGYYYYNVATPMYSVETQLIIQKPEGGGTPGGLGGLLAGIGLGGNEDSIIVQGFLTSREAMLHLDDDLGFIAHFQQDFIDDIQRLPPDASKEDAYKVYKKFVTVGYDPSEGVIRMEVTALTAQAATAFSEALIAYAEERVDKISAPLRADQMVGAQSSYNAAEQAVLDAQQRVLELQQTRGVLSAEAEITGQMGIINSLEVQLEGKRLALAEINANERPNPARANAVKAEIDRLEARIIELRAGMIGAGESGVSLARISGELQIAESELAMRQLLLQQALTQLETARIEANRQVRYLSLGVAPVASDVPTHPKKLQNTAIALVVFLGTYIFLSLTVSILREQIGS